MIITGKLYDRLKFLALILLPALGTLYFTLAGIWGLPAAEQVVGTIVAFDTFLGVVLQISSTKFTSNTGKGIINVTPNPDGVTTFQLEFDDDPRKQIEGKDRVILDVKEQP